MRSRQSLASDGRLKGNIWFGRDGYGACKYDGSSFTRFTNEDGLPSNNGAEKNGSELLTTYRSSFGNPSNSQQISEVQEIGRRKL
jgi:hypothetical protein